MGKQNSIFKALLTGAAIGTAMGVLFAPDSGEKTRERLRDISQQAKDSIEKGSGDLIARARQLRTEVEQLTNRTIEGAPQKVRDEVEALLSAVEEGRKVLKEKRSETGEKKED